MSKQPEKTVEENMHVCQFGIDPEVCTLMNNLPGMTIDGKEYFCCVTPGGDKPIDVSVGDPPVGGPPPKLTPGYPM